MSNSNIIDPSELVALAHQDLACYAIAQMASVRAGASPRIDNFEARGLGARRNHALNDFAAAAARQVGHEQFYFASMVLGQTPRPRCLFSQLMARNFLTISVGAFEISLLILFTRLFFPNCRLSEDSTAANRFHTTAGGSYLAVGRGGSITGRGAHLLIIDDPLKDREEANSQTIRNALKEWYASVAYTRLTADGAIVLIQTRWHEDDLAGWLLREHASEKLGCAQLACHCRAG